MAGLLARPRDGQGPYLRLALLMSQSLWLGITLALVIIIGNALFLADFGSRALPYVYLTVAAAGILLTVGLGAAQRRWNLLQQAIATLSALALFYLLGWFGLTSLRMRWVSFTLLVSFFLVIRLGFVFLGGQAGRLLDLRQIKRLFPLIVSGFVMGFLLGALAVPMVVGLLGSPEQAVLAMAVATLIWLAFLIVTGRRFGAELSQASGSGRSRPAGSPAPSLAQLLRKRFVLLLFGYLLLAGMVTQLADFLVAALVGLHYPTSAAIAQFYSSYTAALNIVDLIFVALVAGVFLSRFGLRAGLLANPVGVGVVFAGLAVVGLVLGPGSTLFFGLAAVANLLQISLTDGATRGATNAAYQALPADERVPVQAAVEGLGGPLAVGLTGLVLLIFAAIPGLTVVHLAVFAWLLIIAWFWLGRLVHRDYSGALLQAMRRRALNNADLSLEDDASLAVVRQLLASERLSDVMLALDVLAACDHSSLDEHLAHLAETARGPILVETLSRIERRRLRAALPQVQRWAEARGDPAAQGAALRALCALLESEAVEQVAPYLSDPRPERRLGVLVGLLRYGGVAGVLAAGERLLDLARSPQPAERVLAAEAMREVAAPGFYAPLLPLLIDPDPGVRQAALRAAGAVRHPRLLPSQVSNLSQSATRSAAVASLVDNGPATLPFVADALSQPAADPLTAIRLARIAGQLGGEAAIAVLKPHLGHPDVRIREQVLSALVRCGYHATGSEILPVEQALKAEANLSRRLLAARRDLGEAEAVDMLRSALDGESEQSRRRIFLLLACLHEAPAILRAENQLSGKDERARALAAEMLDVTLPPAHKALVGPLLDPSLAPVERLRRLASGPEAEPLPRDERLRLLIAPASDAPYSTWTRSCAIYAAARLRATAALDAVHDCQADPDPVVRETARWASDSL